MKKYRILVDSSFGMTKKELLENNFEILPLKIIIDEKEYCDDGVWDGFNTIYEAQQKMSVSTTQNSIFAVEKEVDKLLKKYEKVYYFPITSKISGAHHVAESIEKKSKYKNKLIVLDTKTAHIGSRVVVDKLIPYIEKGLSKKELQKICNKESKNILFYIIPTDLSYLRKGGRLGAAAEIIGGLLKIKILLKFTDRFSKLGKFRSFTSAIDASFEDSNKLFKKYNKNNCDVILFNTSKNGDLIKDLSKYIMDNYNINFRGVKHMTPTFMAHVGPEAFGLMLILNKE